MIHIGTDDTFDELMQGEPYVIVDLYGDYCGSCVALEPVLNEASNDYAMLKFIKVNCSHNPKIAQRFSVRGVPTMLFFRQGKQVCETGGWMERKKLNEYIGTLLYDAPVPKRIDD